MSETLDTATAPATGGAASPARHRALVLVALLAAGFMDFLDAGIVILAAPAIQADLGAPDAAIEWIVAGYILAFAVGLITGGRLGDIAGRKRMFLIGVAGFTVASIACGLADDIGQLIAARVLQGLCAAVMVPQVLSIIQVSYPPEKRGGPLAAYGAMAGLANVSGPVLAGLLVSGDVAGLGWRGIFLINVPVGIAVFAVAALCVTESRSERPLRLDVLGTLLVALALLLVMFPLVEGFRLEWPGWLLASLLAASVPVFVLFARHQRAKQRRDGSPLLPPALFANRAFVAGVLLHITLFAGIAGFWLVFALYAQVGLGFSTLQTGLTSLPWPVAILLVSGIGIAVVGRLGRRLFSIGAVLMIAGMALLAVTVSAHPGGLQSLDLAPGLALTGAGMALIAPSLMNLVLSGAHTRDAGAASGVLSTALQVGSALGVALIGVVFFGSVGAGGAGTAAVYSGAFVDAIWYEIAVFAASFVLIFLLPRTTRRQEGVQQVTEAPV